MVTLKIGEKTKIKREAKGGRKIIYITERRKCEPEALIRKCMTSRKYWKRLKKGYKKGKKGGERQEK